MDAKTYRHHSPILASASDADLLDVALSLLPAQVLEEALQKRQQQSDDRTIATLIDTLPVEQFQQAQAVLFPKTTLKTRPIIARSTGRVFRAQGRPPKDADPIYVDTEEEALRLLAPHELR